MKEELLIFRYTTLMGANPSVRDKSMVQMHA